MPPPRPNHFCTDKKKAKIWEASLLQAWHANFNFRHPHVCYLQSRDAGDLLATPSLTRPASARHHRKRPQVPDVRGRDQVTGCQETRLTSASHVTSSVRTWLQWARFSRDTQAESCLHSPLQCHCWNPCSQRNSRLIRRIIYLYLRDEGLADD